MKKLLWLLPLTLMACTSPTNSDMPPTVPAADPTTAPATSLTTQHWLLQDAVDGDKHRLDGLFDESDKPLQLDFSNDRISVSNACNNLSGNYTMADDRLTTELLMQTMMACADPVLMDRETTMKAVLQGQPSIIVSTSAEMPLLVLTSADGTTLTFAGEPTAQTRYEGPGTVQFLEVSPQPIACDSAGDADSTCLQVRELHYDANGMPDGEPGPWQNLSQPIEGYQHERGVRDVVRVTRYQVPHPSTDGTSVAYVLDLVVESQTVGADDPAAH